jgi:hypothetical protein
VLQTHLETFVLQDLLNRNVLSIFRRTNQLGLEHDPEGAISNDLAITIRDLFGFAGLAFRGNYLDDLVRIVDGCNEERWLECKNRRRTMQERQVWTMWKYHSADRRKMETRFS